jgi:hypothetical protein
MERRVHPRLEVSHPVLYRSDLYRSPKIASTIDLSLGGTKIESLHTLDRDEGLEITIAIRPLVIQCRGRVIHVVQGSNNRVAAGIQFEGMSEKDRVSLRDYLLDVMDRKALEASISMT